MLQRSSRKRIAWSFRFSTKGEQANVNNENPGYQNRVGLGHTRLLDGRAVEAGLRWSDRSARTASGPPAAPAGGLGGVDPIRQRKYRAPSSSGWRRPRGLF